MRVLVTRPQSEATRWAQDLREHGFDALALPLIEIAPVADPTALRDHWHRLERFHAVMFVSGNAVRYFFVQKPDDIGWPARTRAWAPGAGTRAALIEAGLDACAIDAPDPQASQFDSEALWQQVAFQVVSGDRVLIVRGENAEELKGGRDWLRERLVDAGVQVDAITAYIRQSPQWSDRQLAQAQACCDDCVWLFSSSQAIVYLRALMPARHWTRARAVATHPRIAQAARQAGFGVVCESRPVLDAVVAALESFR
jgi:uroporphyrinogen-III synthase